VDEKVPGGTIIKENEDAKAVYDHIAKGEYGSAFLSRSENISKSVR
jgi:hypothetical protein